MSNSNGSDFTKGLLLGTLIGGMAGAITALLLAPSSGKELREELARKSGDMYDKASDYFTTVEANVGSAVNKTVNEGRDRAQHIINAAKRQAEDLLSNAENVLKDAKMKAASAKESAMSKFENIKDAAKASATAFREELNSNKDELES